MSLVFSDLSKAEGLKQLNAYFEGRTFVFGIGATTVDAELLAKVGSCPDATAYPHAARWFNYITSLGKVATKPAAGLSCTVGAVAAAAAAGGDDDDEDSDDLFGDDSEEEEEEMLEVEVKLPKLRERTQFVFDIKPMESEFDLDAFGVKVKQLDFTGHERVEGVLAGLKNDPRCTIEKCCIWGEAHEVEPVAYTICKLVVTCIVLDDVVDSDDIADLIKTKLDPTDELIQSVDMRACNKASAIKLPK